MYVYAQFGIDLAHSVSAQAAAGTRIPLSQAQPGDLVIMNGHDGFYAGNGMILDAPRPGKVVQMRSIWTSDYYIVRING
jgi:cell wall-associated NlpC family hydrolase